MAQLLAWGGLFIGSAVFLRAVDPLPAGASGWWRLWKAVGIMALVAGVAMLVGAFTGSRDPLRPLAGLTESTRPAAPPLPWVRVASLAELEGKLKKPGRPVMLDFYADWCVSCKEMESFTFSDPKVRTELERMLLLQVDVTANNEDDKALLKRFSLFGPPGIIFFDADGREIKGLRVIGYQNAGRFLKTLSQATAP
jgi:thiol:disulfide interchange protein DsbD